jgi:hypothetical protein
MWKFEPVSLADLSAIRASYRLASTEDFHRVLIVAFEGEYGVGSAGNPDAAFMCGASAAGVEAFWPDAVIFDFSRLKYVWGDMLESVYNTAPKLLDEAKQRFAVLVGPECREAVRTLELGEFSTEPLSSIPWAHETLESACEYLQKNVL